MEYHLSVREFVEFLYQSGDLMMTSLSNERALIGSRLHRQLQQQAPIGYQREVYLKIQKQVDDITFIIDGRADGIFTKDQIVYIDEIKTTYKAKEDITDDTFVHWAQAYCYGYIYLVKAQLDTIGIQLRYVQIETNEIITFTQIKTKDELTAFFDDCLAQYMKWAKLAKSLQEDSATSLQQLIFPFDSYRKGQRHFAVSVYKAILHHQTLFAQAPTGIGKTISTLFPSLKAIGEQKAKKIFYLCAKNITATVAIDTIHLLLQQDVHFKSVIIRAKDKMCMLEERNCDPTHCPYAKGYYNRNKEALYEILHTYDIMDSKAFLDYGQKYTICPFELSLDASLYADVIICDYNYVFDPRVYLKRFFLEPDDFIFLVDEAHNLVDRGRSMYSAAFFKSDCLKTLKNLNEDAYKVKHQIHAILYEIKKIEDFLDTSPHTFVKEDNIPLLEVLETFITTCNSYFQAHMNEKTNEILQDFYFTINNYLRISDFYDENFVMYYAKEEDDDIYIKQYCLNPCHPLLNCLKNSISTIFFSATLSPIAYYRDVLCPKEDLLYIQLPSPFLKAQVKVIVNNTISTKYRNRNASILAIVQNIYASVTPKAGNYIVFCPSYRYMQQIAEEFMHQYPEIELSIQSSMMSEDEKQAYLASFEKTTQLHIYFCVLGGMFAEGIDLKADRLLGSIIVGVGLPQLDPQLDMMKEHFDKEASVGYAYAYQYPGMNKVLQAAGRVIRSSSDKGIIVFLDERFTTPFYDALFPDLYKPYEIIQTPQKLYTRIASFWNT